MSGPNDYELAPLSTQLLAHYREMVQAHADDPVTDACPVCNVHRCEDWRFARERLLCAGESVNLREHASADQSSALDSIA